MEARLEVINMIDSMYHDTTLRIYILQGSQSPKSVHNLPALKLEEYSTLSDYWFLRLLNKPANLKEPSNAYQP